MINADIYKALKQINKGTMQFYRLRLVCQKLAEMGLAVPIIEDDVIKGYKLTIKGKIFMWDYDHGKPNYPLTTSGTGEN